MKHPTTTTCRTATFLLLTLSSVACGDGNRTTDDGLGVVVEDSAGVTIVSNDPPPPGSRLPWRFGAQPSLSIGSVDSGEADELFEVADATRLADGRIVIANSGSRELRVFNADGSHAGTWGRRGEGPGEFTYGPSAVALWPGDSIAASNRGGREVSLFDLDGNHGRDVTLNTSLSNVVALMPAGKIVASSVMLEPETRGSPNLVGYITEWAILDADGGQHASLGEFLVNEYWTRGPDGSIQTPHPFGRQTSSAAWGELVAIGVQDSYEIKAFAADGSPVRIVRRGDDREDPTQEDLDAFFDRLGGNLPEAARARRRSMLKDMPLVDSYPAFEEILSDRLGYLWVREYRMFGMFGEGAAVWTVFDPEGRVQGLVETPAGLEVFEIGEDYVLGSAEDELGVEYVRVWGLDRG